MKLDLDFELEEPGWKRAIACIPSGTEISAQRFFAILGSADEEEAMEAAMELETRRIGLDVSGLPQWHQGQAGQRLKLEAELAGEGRLPEGLGKDDPLKMYWKEVKRIKPLTAQEAEECLKQDVGCAVEGLLWLVVEQAPAFAGQGVLLMDLMQEGAMGLMRALEQPEEDLMAGARWCIRQAMARAVALQYLTSGEADRLMDSMRAYQQADRHLLEKLGRNPSLEELAHQLGKTPDEVQTLGKMVQEAAKVPKMKHKEEAPEENTESVEDSAYFQLRSRVEELLSALEEKDRELLTLRFGLGGKPPLSQEEAAKALSISLEEEQKRELAAMAFLRQQ